DLFVGAVRVEDLVVNAGQVIVTEAADGFGAAQNRVADVVFVKCDQRAVAFLDFDDAILYSHAGKYKGWGIEDEARIFLAWSISVRAPPNDTLHSGRNLSQ